MTPCNGNHSVSAPCDDPNCGKVRQFLPFPGGGDKPAVSQVRVPHTPMVFLCLTVARCLGLLQRALGASQTRVLALAWEWGWRPDSKEMVDRLKKRVIGLEVRRQMAANLKAERQLERDRKRFHKNYGA